MDLIHFTSTNGDQFSIAKDYIAGFMSFTEGGKRIFSIMLRNGDDIELDEVEFDNIKNLYIKTGNSRRKEY